MRPSARLKVHRYTVSLDGRAATVLRLRPDTKVRFATNTFHQTWHLLSDPGGASVLGRLCWALAYQRKPDTLVVLHTPELVPNPFDADPSNTVVLSNSVLGPFSAAMATQLRDWLRRTHASEGTVTLQTPGLDEESELEFGRNRRPGKTWIDVVNGCLVLAGPPEVLRNWAIQCDWVGKTTFEGSDYEELSWPRREGEVQVYTDFTRRVTRAVVARERLFPGRGHERLLPAEREAVWAATAPGPSTSR